MNKQTGLWIDRREAIIVKLSDGEEEIKHIASNVEKREREAGDLRNKTPIAIDDQLDRKYATQLSKYYDQVIADIREADAIQIFGPGEAKTELRKRIEYKGLADHVVAVETADKMTDRQIAAKVRDYFTY